MLRVWPSQMFLQCYRCLFVSASPYSLPWLQCFPKIFLKPWHWLSSFPVRWDRKALGDGTRKKSLSPGERQLLPSLKSHPLLWRRFWVYFRDSTSPHGNLSWFFTVEPGVVPADKIHRRVEVLLKSCPPGSSHYHPNSQSAFSKLTKLPFKWSYCFIAPATSVPVK